MGIFKWYFKEKVGLVKEIEELLERKKGNYKCDVIEIEG